MKKVLILQNKILHFRKAFYNHLAKHYDVTILHSGTPSITSADKYKEVIYPTYKIGPFFWQKGILSMMRRCSYNSVIAMADLHWIMNTLFMFFKPSNLQFIWWGPWLTSRKWANWFRCWLFKQPNPIIFYTEEARQEFIKHGIVKEKLFVANNTIEVADRAKSYEYPKKNLILFVGSLNPRKQLDELIHIFHKIQKKIDSNIQLMIVGDGSMKDSLHQLVIKLNLTSRVVFSGEINDPNVLKNYYKKAIFSVSLGQAGLAVLQSLGNGVPFVTKENAISGGEKSNIKHGINGEFCKDNPTDIENTMIRLCQDKSYSYNLGKNAYNYYNDFCTIEKMVEGFVSAINYHTKEYKK